MKRFYLHSIPLLFISLIVLFAVSGCGVTRKVQAANILKQCKAEIHTIEMDSVVINPELFKKLKASSTGLLPNPQVIGFVQNLSRGIIEIPLGKSYLKATFTVKNPSQDSLWLRGLQAQLFLDSLLVLPITYSDSSFLMPGDNQLNLHTQLLLDQPIFAIPQVRTIRVKGVLRVALDKEGEDVLFEFDEFRPVTESEMNLILQQTREATMNGLVGDWVGKLL